MVVRTEGLPPVHWVLHRLAQWLFRLTGWRTEGEVPAVSHCVIVAAPHTSYWDAILMVTAGCAFNVKFSWMVKDAAFFFPLGILVRAFGGIPINRARRANVVAQAIETFRTTPALALAVSPEGTRRQSDHWKTGFYQIALGAKVPIVLSYLDYKRKVTGLGLVLQPTGDIEADFREFAAFYEQVTPRYPALRGRVAVRPPADS